jgi:hypothetical protein
MAPAVHELARKLIWWKTPEEALRWPDRLIAQVMALGTWDDVETVRNVWGDEGFRRVLSSPPPGVFDLRSWNYWHVYFGIEPVPPLPARRIPAHA